MAEQTARLALPQLEAGQAQKEIVHNEALAILDALVQPAVTSCGDDDPPAAPADGACYIVGGAPTGAWTGQAGAIAAWTGGGWRFTAPFEGAGAWIVPAGLPARFGGGRWLVGTIDAAALRIGGIQVVGPQQPRIADPAGGTVIDAAARAALASVLAALREHGLIGS